MNKEEIAEWFKSLQDRICSELEALDGKSKFKQDLWERPNGGGGRSRVIENGNLIEKGGVNFSAVFGKTPEKILNALKLENADFYATGVSIVLHPNSPMVPIIHMNVRYFEMDNGIFWFGGGIDLTPHYVVEEDAKTFHSHLKSVCDKYSKDFYSKFKTWADDYFFIKHRNETRGIGGIFFDRLSDKTTDLSKDQLWSFVQDVGNTFVPAYSDSVKNGRKIEFTNDHKEWQMIRRGRYVEFNLVYDKGTKFGLDTNGRTESILMSMPPQAFWHYDHSPSEGSAEEKTLTFLVKGKDWIND